MNKKIRNIIFISGLIIIICIVIFIVILFNSGKNISTFNSTLNTGEPLISNINELQTTDIYKSLQSTRYNLNFTDMANDYGGTNITAINFVNGIYYIANLSNNNSKTFTNYRTNIIIPQITIPVTRDNIKCNNNEGYLLSRNSSTIFYYNQPINNINKSGCIYYTTMTATNPNPNTNILEFNCISLPRLNTSLFNQIQNLEYDKVRLMSCNSKILVIITCSDMIYYLPLQNSLNINNPNTQWKLFPNFIQFNIPDIKKITMNDKSIFLYTLKSDNVKNIFNINYILTGDANNPNITTNIIQIDKIINNNITSLMASNDVLFYGDYNFNTSTSYINWCYLGIDNNGNLVNNWKQFSIGDKPIKQINYLNNILYIYYGASYINNYRIPLNYPLSTFSRNTLLNNTNTSLPIPTSGNMQPNTTTLTTTSTANTMSTTSTANTANTMSTTSTANTANTTNTANTANAANTITSQSGYMSSNTTANIETSNTNFNTAYSLINDVLNSGNMNNSRNLYISPMNKPELYYSKNDNSKSADGKISSSFFPLVRIY